MESRSLSPVPVALGSASADTEKGRAFFQDRLGLYAKWIFILSGMFVLLGLVTLRDPVELLKQYSLAHIGATLTLGTVWAATRMFRFTTRALFWIDAAAFILPCGLFAVMAGGVAHELIAISADPIQALLVGQLACSSTVLTRALAVPSTPTRTSWLTVAALIPQAAYGSWVVFTAGLDGGGLPSQPRHAAAPDRIKLLPPEKTDKDEAPPVFVDTD